MGDVITKFKLETTQYDSKLRDATEKMRDLMRNVQAAGGSLNDLSSKSKALASSFGSIDVGAKNVKDKVRELTQAFNTTARAYNAMTKDMQSSDVGIAIADQMIVLKQRLSEAKKELYDMGDAEEEAAGGGIDFGAVLQSLGSQLGINTKLLSSLTSGTLATTAAVTAGAAAVVAATKAWADYNDEVNRQNTMTTVVTGLKGRAGEELTIGVRALARTYDVDFRQAIEAANTLMQQFGVSGSEALKLLQDGMQGMLVGDGGKLLSMIKQYAPSFRDAGIEASQLVAIIQNSEGGLFTDQNMNAIVMGIRNIRHQTEATQKALAGLGIDGKAMMQKLNDGSMTVFEALRQVSDAIDTVGSGSDAAGAIMQNVFGRQGTMAGTKLGEAIATLNLNLEETKRQTGELGESFVKLNEANLRLERTMQEVFGMNGWEDMSNTIKTEFADAISDALDYIIDVREALNDIGTSDSFATLADAAMKFMPALWPLLKGLEKFTGLLEQAKKAWDDLTGKTSTGGGGTFSGIGQGISNSIKGLNVPRNVLSEVVVTPGGGNGGGGGGGTSPKGGSKSTPWAPIAMGDFTGIDITGRSVNDVTKDIQQAQAKFNAAGDEMGRAMAKAMIEALQKEKETMMNEGDVTKGGFADAYNHDFSKDIKKLDSQMKNGDNLAEQGKKVQESWREAAGAIGSVGNALAGLEDPGAKIVGTVGQAIAQIALGFAQATAKTGGTTGVFGWIAAVAGGLGTMLSTISAIHSATGYAEGGIVGGNSFSGDRVPGIVDGITPVGLNSGELILNKSQQNSIAAQLTSTERGGGAVSTPSYVKGEDIFLGVNNYLRRKGRGELVTSR